MITAKEAMELSNASMIVKIEELIKKHALLGDTYFKVAYGISDECKTELEKAGYKVEMVPWFDDYETKVSW